MPQGVQEPVWKLWIALLCLLTACQGAGRVEDGGARAVNVRQALEEVDAGWGSRKRLEAMDGRLEQAMEPGAAALTVVEDAQGLASKAEPRAESSQSIEDGEVGAAQVSETPSGGSGVVYKEENAQYCIVIDAGHQRKGNSGQEPIGPGAAATKAKVTGGTKGVASGLYEYELNLQVALALEEELLARGYRVVQVRSGHDVDISNAQRAAIANEAGADAFLRIHANGSADPDKKGAMTICQTADNPYNGHLYQRSRALSEAVLEEILAATGCEKDRLWETDTMSGINWSQVPVTIVEMGYMSNAQEDALLATAQYQAAMVEGMVKGIERYLAEHPR